MLNHLILKKKKLFIIGKSDQNPIQFSKATDQELKLIKHIQVTSKQQLLIKQNFAMKVLINYGRDLFNRRLNLAITEF